MVWQLYDFLTSWQLHKVCFNLHIPICQYEELIGVRTLLHSRTQHLSGKAPQRSRHVTSLCHSCTLLADHNGIQECERSGLPTLLRVAAHLFRPPHALSR